MTTDLHASLERLARELAEGVLGAIRTACIQDLVCYPSREVGRRQTTRTGTRGRDLREGAPSRSTRLPPRSEEDIASMLDQVLGIVRTSNGLRSEDIRKALAFDKRDVTRVLKAGLLMRKLKRHGSKRSTIYSLV